MEILGIWLKKKMGRIKFSARKKAIGESRRGYF